MRFNPDCVRDILFECENCIEPNKELCLSDTELPNSLSNYSWAEILYRLKQCQASGLFDDKSFENIIGEYEIHDITPKAHELLEKIRSEKVWKKILEKSVSSIPTLITTAIEIFTLFNT